ncbi:unknown [Clostridium sp. CAG:169]|nr:unknown [Clostridium sp. CAG:169]
MLRPLFLYVLIHFFGSFSFTMLLLFCLILHCFEMINFSERIRLVHW